MRLRSRSLSAVVLTIGLVTAACSSTPAPGDETAPATSSSTSASASASTVPTGGDLTLANLNLLHGLPLGSSCPAETDGCALDARLQLVFDHVEAAGCPGVLLFQEVGPAHQTLIPERLPELCDGAYELVSERPGLPVEQWILSSLPATRAVSRPISGVSRSVQLVTVESAMGPVDVITAHFVAGIDNLPCTDELCTEICELGVEAGVCNPHEILDLIAAEADPTTLTVFTGDLNGGVASPRVTTLLDAGFVDTWALAGNPECDAATGIGCTCCTQGPGGFGGIDSPDLTYSSRIDFVLALAPPGCDLRADTPDDADGDGTSTGGFADTAAAAALEGIWWASDHGGVQADLSCG